ncbi:MAG TPA: fibronectin type III domain-containing protein, partial [Gaiellaceae bacterium]|nr:fibronectin type III domain-containing protein [Gaiellaceae bacterium]
TTNSGVNDGSLNVNQAGVDAQIAASGAQFAISVGDVAYPGGTQTEYGDLNQTGANVSAVFGPSYWALPGQSVPLLQVDGNHGQNVNSITTWPETLAAAAAGGSYQMRSYPSIDGTTPGSYPDTYYAFSVGGVRFYLLEAAWGNSNTGTATGGACGQNCAIYQVDHDAHWTVSSAEYQWLARDLAAHPGGLKFAFFHFPLYADNATQTSDAYLDNTPGSTGSLEQLLHDNGVQLVFTGHAHIYERNISRPGGVISYVTGGGGGQAEPVSHCSTTDAYAIGWSYSKSSGSACGAATPPTTDAQVYHFLKVSVDGSTVTVAPTDSQGHTFDVQTYDFSPDTSPPTAPGRLTLSRNPKKNILNWTPATDNIAVVAYDIYRNGLYLATVGPQTSTFTDASAVPGVRYTYRVAARDLAGNTTSATVTTAGTADTTPPSTPSNPAVSASGWTTASLAWGASTDNVRLLYYQVFRDGSPVAQVPAGTTSYVDTELSPGTTYTYRVAAVDASGNASAPSSPVTVTTPTDSSPPTAPANLTGAVLASSQVLLSWDDSSDNVGVVRYDILRNGVVVGSSAGSSYLDDPGAGTTSVYQVIAYDAAGNSTASSTIAVTTPPLGELFFDGFETGDLSQWTTASGLTVETSLAHTGTYGVEAASTGAPTYADVALPGSYDELWAQAWVYVASRSTSVPLLGFRRSGGGSIVYLYVSQTGKLALRNNVGSVTTTSATPMPTGAWHSLTLHVVVDGAASSVDVSLDGTPVSDLALTGQNLGSSPMATLELGSQTGGTYDVYLDDVAVSQNPF